MPTQTAGALGTQRNFTPQPENIYEKKLTSRPSSVGRNSFSNGGMELAKALGVLGTAIGTEAASEEVRKEKLGIAAAEEIVSGQTPESLSKLSAAEMLQNYGPFDVADNPYAIALVEKMRGKYFGAKAKDEYATFRAEQPPAKTADEELQRYSQFAQQKHAEVQGVSSDPTAFHKGFFDNDLANQLDVYHTRAGELDKERQVIVEGSVRASLGEINAKSMGLQVADVVKGYNTAFADTRFTGVSIPKRLEIAKDALKQYATQTGQADKIDELAKGVILGVNKDGKPVTMGSAIDTFDYKVVASQRQTHMFGERMQKEIERLQKGSKEEANMQYDTWQKNDPAFFNSMLPFRDNIFNAQVKREEKEKLQTLNDSSKSFIDRQAFANIDQQLRAYNAGNTHDVAGNRVATTPGDLPKVKYKQYNLDGSVVEKEKEVSEQHLTAYIDYQLQQIKNDQSKTPEQRGAATVNLLSAPIAKKYADTVSMQMNNALDTLTVDKLGKGQDMKPQLTGILEDTFAWYRTNPEAFYKIFGSEVSRKLETVQTLALATGDLREAAGLYAQGRERSKDGNFTRKVKSDISVEASAALRGSSGGKATGFSDLSGNDAELKVSLASNRSIMERVETLAEQLTYAGMDPKAAVKSAMDTARRTHRVWRDTALPVAVFNGINSEDRGKVGGEVLDYYLDRFIQDTRLDPQHVSTTFDVDRGVFRITGGGAFVIYNLNDIAYSGNYLIEQRAKQPKEPQKNITQPEVDELRRPLEGLPDNFADN